MNKIQKLLDALSSNKITHILLNVLIIIVIIFLFYMTRVIWATAFSTIWLITRPFLVAFVIAFVLNSLVEWIHDYVPSHGAAVIMVYFGVIALFILILALIIPLLYDSLVSMVPTILNGLNVVKTFMTKNFNIDISQLINRVREFIEGFVSNSNLWNNTFNIFNEIINQIMNWVIYLTLAIYMSFTYNDIRIFIKKQAAKINSKFPSYLTKLDYSLTSYTKAFTISAAIQGITTAFMYLIIGHQNWAVMGILSAVSSFIPYIGPIVANGLGLITSFSLGTGKIIFLIILIFIQSILMGYVVTPKIYSSQIGLSVMTVLFAILSGSTLFGIWGVIVAIPLFVAIKIIYKLIITSDLDEKSYKT